jgi:transposase
LLEAKEMMLEEKIYNKRGLRVTLEGMFYLLRVGYLWRDFPLCFGQWNSGYKKFNEWSKKGKW